MATTYPIGYGRQTVTMDELRRRYEGKMHPEFARRLFAWLESRGGDIGIGSAWRVTPHRCSAASRAGHSFHQNQRYASGFVGGAAVDLVVRNGTNVHRAPRWSEVPKQDSGHPDIEKYGVHMNISSETWHLQAVEHDGWGTWARTGRKDPQANYPIASEASAPPARDPGWPSFDPVNGVWGLWPLNGNKPHLSVGDDEDAVYYLQGVLNLKAGGDISVDGQFGNQTAKRVRDFQDFFGLPVDGKVDRQTWGSIDYVATA